MLMLVEVFFQLWKLFALGKLAWVLKQFLWVFLFLEYFLSLPSFFMLALSFFAPLFFSCCLLKLLLKNFSNCIFGDRELVISHKGGKTCWWPQDAWPLRYFYNYLPLNVIGCFDGTRYLECIILWERFVMCNGNYWSRGLRFLGRENGFI